MTRRVYRLILLSAIALTAACNTLPRIGYDFDPAADFSAYRTYAWMPGPQAKTGDRRVDNSAVDIRIRTAVDTRLRLKGYAPSPDGKPDFFLTYHAGVKELAADSTSQFLDPTMAGIPFSMSADTRNMGKPRQEPEAKIDPRLSGSLLVDVIDAETNKLVWRGTAAGEVDPGLTSQERDARMRAIVEKMFSHFPPK